MGKRGPKPRERRVNIILPLSVPRPPDWLDGQALKKWNEIIPQLEATGRLSVLDGGALVRYCVMWSQYMDCYAITSTGGMTYESYFEGQGMTIKKRPEMELAKSLQSEMFKIETAMGMTVAMRNTLVPVEKEEEEVNPFEALRLSLKKSG